MVKKGGVAGGIGGLAITDVKIERGFDVCGWFLYELVRVMEKTIEQMMEQAVDTGTHDAMIVLVIEGGICNSEMVECGRGCCNGGGGYVGIWIDNFGYGQQDEINQEVANFTKSVVVRV